MPREDLPSERSPAATCDRRRHLRIITRAAVIWRYRVRSNALQTVTVTGDGDTGR